MDPKGVMFLLKVGAVGCIVLGAGLAVGTFGVVKVVSWFFRK